MIDTLDHLAIAGGMPGSVWNTQFSWMLVSSPTTIGSLSARSTAPAMIVQRSPSVTAPISVASGAM